MGNFGPAEMLVIGIFALLVFGPQRLPEMARQFGKALREFKKVTGEFSKELKLGLDDDPQPRKTDTAEEEPRELRPGPK